MTSFSLRRQRGSWLPFRILFKGSCRLSSSISVEPITRPTFIPPPKSKAKLTRDQ
jgi:hypothetical protein